MTVLGREYGDVSGRQVLVTTKSVLLRKLTRSMHLVGPGPGSQAGPVGGQIQLLVCPLIAFRTVIGWVAMLRSSIVAAIGMVLAPAELRGQNGPPAFEVASIKRAAPHPMGLGIFTYPGGRIAAYGYTLEKLIEEAFGIQPFQVSGGPRWIREDRYDVVAKPPESSKSSKSMPPYPKAPPNDEQRQMLQTLLQDRFGLQYHRDTREGPVYLLVRTNKDLKL